MSTQRVAFILCEYPLGVSSMVINSIRLFAAKGFRVDVYINKRTMDSSPIDFREKQVSFNIYDDDSLNLVSRGYRYILMQISKLLAPIVRYLSFNFCLFMYYHDVFLFSRWLKKKLSDYSYVYFMPIECKSLLCLNHINDKNKIIYYNMELLDWEDEDRYKQTLKKLEYQMISELSNAVIPSPRRAELFAKINDFDLSKIFILPVASMGDPIRARSKYFRELFGIPDDWKIVVYSGNIAPWAKCLEIIQSVKDWPDGYALVMHTWNKSVVGTRYYNEMINEARGLPVYFSSEYITYDDLAVALSSADIGVMFYEEIDDNFTEILFSSNKFGEYLKAGLAIICSEFVSLKDFVEERSIGAAISIRELPRAVRLIGEKIEILRENAHACYEEQLRFENYFERFYDRLVSEGHDA